MKLTLKVKVKPMSKQKYSVIITKDDENQGLTLVKIPFKTDDFNFYASINKVVKLIIDVLKIFEDLESEK